MKIITKNGGMMNCFGVANVGYLPIVTTPCQSAPTPASRRIGVSSGNDIPMITELG